MEIKIGYQGIEGSNSEEVSLIFSRKHELREVKFIPLISAKNVVNALVNKEIDYGVLAIRNSITGIVEETEKALSNVELVEIAKEKIPIQHFLFKKKNVESANITNVASHIQALKQTRNTRKNLYPNWNEIEMEDTALAAKYLAIGNLDDNTAVICRKNAGKLYNLELIAENLEDNPNNYTEFGIFEM